MKDAVPDQKWITCPGCSEAFNLESDEVLLLANGMIQCPYCSTRFSIASASQPVDEFVVVDDTDAPILEVAPPSDDVDKDRVKTLARLRMGYYRSQSYCLIGVLFMVVAAVKLGILAQYHLVHDKRVWLTALYAAFSIGAVIGAIILAKKFVAIGREVRATMEQAPPTVPPDFSTLGNGSDRRSDWTIRRKIETDAWPV